ncbi:MAG: flagellar biosynthesis anti-sigma factor FlgM [Bacillota bacterium]
MRINSIPSKDLYYQYVYMSGKTTTPISYASKTDKVELTDQAKTFSATLKAAKEMIGTRDASEQSRIESIRRQINAGTYSIPGDKVAEKILGN